MQLTDKSPWELPTEHRFHNNKKQQFEEPSKSQQSQTANYSNNRQATNKQQQPQKILPRKDELLKNKQLTVWHHNMSSRNKNRT